MDAKVAKVVMDSQALPRSDDPCLPGEPRGLDDPSSLSPGERSASSSVMSNLLLETYQTAQPCPTDAQLLYWTLEDDGVLPPGYEQDFTQPMPVVCGAAERQARATFLDSPQAALYLHNHAKEKAKVCHKAKSAEDQFALALNLRPRRYKTRFERTLYTGATPRKDAEEAERSRWIHILATLVMGSPTPVGALLQAQPSDFQYLGAGRRASTLRSLVRHVQKFLAWHTVAHNSAFSSTVQHLVAYMKTRLAEPCNRGALRNINQAYELGLSAYVQRVSDTGRTRSPNETSTPFLYYAARLFGTSCGGPSGTPLTCVSMDGGYVCNIGERFVSVTIAEFRQNR